MLMQFEDNTMSATEQNDEEDIGSTMDSIKQAEKSIGSEMKVPVANDKFYEIHGNKYENLMADNARFSMSEIDEA
jgi:hypothetical protein